MRYCIATAKSGDTINFDPNVFNNPTSINLSAAIAINNKDLTIDGQSLDVTIDGNISGPNICRIFTITGTSNVEIDNLTLASAKAASTDNNGNGGAIYDNAAKLTLNKDDFLQNVAQGAGGAIYTSTLAGPLAVTSCNFAYNTASNDGGALYVSTSGQNVVLKMTGFTGNVAGGNGGAIDAEDGPDTQLTMNDCTFQGNHTTTNSSGGAIYTTDQFQDLDSTYSNNYAQEGGGSIYWVTPALGATVAESVKISYDTFTSNQAGDGGAVALVTSATQGTVTQTILGCLFNDNKAWSNNGLNQAPYHGGGLSATEATSNTGSIVLNVYNSTFYQNVTEGNGNADGGGIYLFISTAGTGTSTTQLTSLTVYQNSADFDGGGLYIDPDSNFGTGNAVPLLKNCIIAENQYSASDFASGPDISGSVYSRGHNLIGVGNGAIVTSPPGNANPPWNNTDKVGSLGSPVDPLLDPNGLTSNGGPTLTITPVGDSYAFNHGSLNLDAEKDGTQLDQRGYKRPAMNTTIGAYDPGARRVQQGQSSTTVASSANPAVVGQPVTFTAEVITGSGTPTGTVAFYDGSTALGTVTLDEDGFASLTTSTLTLGNHNITATYSGDENSTGSSGTLTQIISNEINGSMSLSSSLNPAAPTQAVTFTATIRGSSGTPTGTVTFMDGNTVLGTASLDANGNAAFTTSTLTLGSHTIMAVYSGDATYASNAASLKQTISQGGTYPNVSADINQAQPGQNVTFTATIFTEGGSGTPTGTVTFLDGTTTLGTGTVSAIGGLAKATFTTSFSNGYHDITAVYSGDAVFMGSSGSMTEQVGQPPYLPSSVSLSTSVDPSQPGQSVTFTATVTSSYGFTPTGSVTFLDGTTVLGTAALDASGNAVFTTSALGAGNHDITAIYSGDSSDDASSGSLIQQVSQSATSLSLSSSANPSPQGQDVTFTATLTAMGGGTPTGTVSFYDGTTLLGSADVSLVNGQYQASFTTAALGLGSHTIVAIYSDDSTFADSGASLDQSITS